MSESKQRPIVLVLASLLAAGGVGGGAGFLGKQDAPDRYTGAMAKNDLADQREINGNLKKRLTALEQNSLECRIYLEHLTRESRRKVGVAN